MKYFKIAMKILGVLLILFIALVGTGLYFLGKNVCGNDLIKESSSPDRKYTASFFERNCGATTNFVRIISLRETESSFDPEEREDWVFANEGQEPAEMIWDSNSKLKIVYAGPAHTKIEKWQDVNVEFSGTYTR